MKSKIVLQRFTGMQVTESKIMFIYKIKPRRPVSLSIPSCVGVGALVTHSSREFGCAHFRGHLQKRFFSLGCAQTSVFLFT